jgi:hypothetical protein
MGKEQMTVVLRWDDATLLLRHEAFTDASNRLRRVIYVASMYPYQSGSVFSEKLLLLRSVRFKGKSDQTVTAMTVSLILSSRTWGGWMTVGLKECASMISVDASGTRSKPLSRYGASWAI